MSLSTRQFLRLSKLARKPRSLKQFLFFLGILVVCAGLFAIEKTVGWPDALTPQKTGRIR